MKRTYFKNSVFLIILLGLFSCKPTGQKTVDAILGNLLEPATISTTPNFELGEMITTEISTDITITISNNSSDQFRDLSYTFDNSENIFDFKPDADGLAFSPGEGGTCQTTLAPNTSCTYIISLIPRKQGEFNIPGKISYTNKVEPQVKNINYHLISGQPASLVFTNDVSNYNLGILEQTERIERFIDLEIQNAGGLPARNLDVTINNDIDAGYKLISHNCPSTLMMKQSCQAKVSYTPQNNNYTDPEVIFTGQLIFNYIKDPLKNPGTLYSYFSFTSAAIEGKFATNFPAMNFQAVVTGNKAPLIIKLINMGYREGILKQLILKKSDGSTAAICIKDSNSIMLKCGDSNGASLDLEHFPFTVEDTNSCFENQVVSYLSANGSPNCFFKVTYWPSINYSADSHLTYNFDSSHLTFVYDSKWRGNVNLVTKDNIFNIAAQFQARANLQISKIELDGNDISSTLVTLNNITSFNLGRLALITPGFSSVYYTVKIYYKNTGEVPSTLLNLYDGQNPAQPMGGNYNAYYTSINTSGCATIAGNNAECNISFRLSPVQQASSAQNDALMYDDYTTDLFNKFKVFNFSYTDGSIFNDDGSNITSRNLEARFTSLLVSKGKLFITPQNVSWTTLTNEGHDAGQSIIQSVILKNIGTGKVAAIQYDSANTLEVPSAGVASVGTGAAAGKDNYPYRLSTFASHAEALPSGVDYDCLEDTNHLSANIPVIIRPSTPASFFHVLNDTNIVLEVGKSCAIRIEAKLPKNASTLTSSVPNEFQRFWAMGISNTQDAWMYWPVSVPAITAKFNYWDGDDFSATDSNSLPFFGYRNSSDTLTTLTLSSSQWNAPARLAVSKIEPIASATLYRKGITYPSVSENFPFNNVLAGSTIDPQLFTNADFLPNATISPFVLKTTNIRNYYNLLDPSVDSPAIENPMIYIGSIKKSTDFYSTISFTNFGGSRPQTIQLADDNGDSGFTITKFAYLNASNDDVYQSVGTGTANFDIVIKVNIATAGTYQHCYDVNYESSLGTRVYKFCAIIDIIDNMANLQIDYKNNDVTWDVLAQKFAVTPDGNWTAFNAPYNKLSVCDNNNNCTTPSQPNEVLYLSSVASTAASCTIDKNCQYDQKTVRITNTGNSPLSDLNIGIAQLPSRSYVTSDKLFAMDCSNYATAGYNFTNILDKIAVCQSEIDNCKNLAPNASCTLNFIYTPASATSLTLDSMIVLSHSTKSFSNSASTYVNHYIPFKYEGLTSAAPVVANYSRMIIDGTNPTYDGTPASYTVSFTSSGVPVTNLSDPANPRDEQNSFPIHIGTYLERFAIPGNPYIEPSYQLTSMSKVQSIFINLKNNSSTRISFLKANPNPLSNQWNQVYPPLNSTYNQNTGAGKAKIFASQGCFYGGVLNDNTIPVASKGFNSSSLGVDLCQLRLDFSGDITYHPVASSCSHTTDQKIVQMGGEIDPMCNPYVYKIPFWSYKRSASDSLTIHVLDFIEPNRSAYYPGYDSYAGCIDTSCAPPPITNTMTNYVSASSAKISFTLFGTTDPVIPSIAENYPQFGLIKKFRIFWSKTPSAFSSTSDIFKMAPNNPNFCYIDTADATTPANITLSTCAGNSANNIVPGTYYYIKVMAIRTTDASFSNQTDVPSFMSDPKIPLVIAATPINAGMTYVDAIKSFIDTGVLNNTLYSQSNAVKQCALQIVKISDATNGLISNRKLLVGWQAWGYISNYTVPSVGYPANEPGNMQHWLNEPYLNISNTRVKDYYGATVAVGSGFNSVKFPGYKPYPVTQGVYAPRKLIYNNCTDVNNDYKNCYSIVGGDGVQSYPMGVLYTNSTVQAFARCYTHVLCPFDPTMYIDGYNLTTGQTCKLPY